MVFGYWLNFLNSNWSAEIFVFLYNSIWIDHMVLGIYPFLLGYPTSHCFFSIPIRFFFFFLLVFICFKIFSNFLFDFLRSVNYFKAIRGSQYQRRAMPNNTQTTTQLHSFHMQARSSSKSAKAGFNSKWTEDFQIYKLDLEKVKKPEIKLSTSVGSQKTQENSKKHTSTSASLTMLSLCLYGSQQTVENS